MRWERWLVVLLGLVPVVAVLGVGVWLYGPVIVDSPDQFRETAPQASFNYTHYPSNSTLVITHTGGNEFHRITTRRLVLYVTDGKTPNVTSVRPTESISLPFHIGETVTVSNVEYGDVVYLIWWESERSNGEGTIIDKHTIGEEKPRGSAQPLRGRSVTSRVKQTPTGNRPVHQKS